MEISIAVKGVSGVYKIEAEEPDKDTLKRIEGYLTMAKLAFCEGRNYSPLVPREDVVSVAFGMQGVRFLLHTYKPSSKHCSYSIIKRVTIESEEGKTQLVQISTAVGVSAFFDPYTMKYVSSPSVYTYSENTPLYPHAQLDVLLFQGENYKTVVRDIKMLRADLITPFAPNGYEMSYSELVQTALPVHVNHELVSLSDVFRGYTELHFTRVEESPSFSHIYDTCKVGTFFNVGEFEYEITDSFTTLEIGVILVLEYKSGIGDIRQLIVEGEALHQRFKNL